MDSFYGLVAVGAEFYETFRLIQEESNREELCGGNSRRSAFQEVRRVSVGRLLFEII